LASLALGWTASRRPIGKRLRRRKLFEMAADRASELQANIAQPKRMSAGQSPALGASFVGHL